MIQLAGAISRTRKTIIEPKVGSERGQETSVEFPSGSLIPEYSAPKLLFPRDGSIPGRSTCSAFNRGGADRRNRFNRRSNQPRRAGASRAGSWLRWRRRLIGLFTRLDGKPGEQIDSEWSIDRLIAVMAQTLDHQVGRFGVVAMDEEPCAW